MSHAELEKTIDAAFEAREEINAQTGGAVREAVTEALNLLDSGAVRVAEPAGNHQWVVNSMLNQGN